MSLTAPCEVPPTWAAGDLASAGDAVGGPQTRNTGEETVNPGDPEKSTSLMRAKSLVLCPALDGEMSTQEVVQLISLG